MSYSDRIINHTNITLTSKKTGEKTVLLETKNGAVVGPVLAGIPITECVDDSLDSFVFVLMNVDTKKLFKPFDVVEFTVDDGIEPKTYEMCVFSDHAQTHSPMNHTYKHTVTVIESTKILEKVKVFNMNLTNPNDTLLRQFQKAIQNAEPVIRTVDNSGNVLSINHECRFKIADELASLLNNMPGEDFWFSNTELRTILDGILAPCNARVEVKKINFKKDGDTANIDTIELTYRSLTEVKKITPVWTREEQGEIINEELENNGQDFAGTIVARGYNTLMQEPVTFTDVFKSETDTLSDNSACVVLPFPISSNGIKEFRVVVKCIADEHYNYVPVNIPVIASEQYDLLSESDKKTCIPYIIGSTKFSVCNYSSNVLGFKQLTIEKIIRDNFETRWGNKYKLASDKWYDNSFEIEYYPQINTMVEFTKPSVYDKDEILMGIMDNQSENNLDLQRHGKRLDSLIKRTGNDEYYIDVNAKYFSKLLPVMAKIPMPADKTGYSGGDYVVYKREFGVYDMFLKCRYYLSKNFNAVQKLAGVKREKHLYDIPLESDECPILIKKYLIFGLEYKESRTIFERWFLNSALGTIINDGGWISRLYLFFKSYCNNEIFPQNTENSKGEMVYCSDGYRFASPLLSYIQLNTINFVASPMDNYSVGYSRDGYTFSMWGDGGNKITYNRYVSKAENTVGECDKFQLWLLPYLSDDAEVAHEQAKNLPIIYRALGEEDVSIELKFNKDRSQKPIFCFSIECISDKDATGKIFIGPAFYQNNLLMSDINRINRRLAVSYSGEFTEVPNVILDSDYTMSDEYGNVLQAETYFRMMDESESIGGTTGLVYNNNMRNNATIKSWAIVDWTTGKVYLAVNGPLRNIYCRLAELPE